MKIIINNVYAFQYPAKNRCTILVQPSFAKLVLLPIREAYEWKRVNSNVIKGLSIVSAISLLPIREAYEWKPQPSKSIAQILPYLLPIREAYEWKQYAGSIYELTLQFFTSN